MWWRKTLTFNPDNLMWIGSIQPVDDEVSEICLDLDIDGIWYTLWIRMLKADLKNCMELLDQMLPDRLQIRRNRERPNLRHAPIHARRAGSDGNRREGFGDPIELYLTPLYLVEISNTFIARTIDLDSIQSFEVKHLPDLPPDTRWLRLALANDTVSYVVTDHSEFERRLAELVR